MSPPLTITFLTGSLERSRDGVGDYTRWLASEATRQGASCRLLALADRHVNGTVIERDGQVEVMRVPLTMPWTARRNAAMQYVRSSTADWLSLQFVPYSFHKQGLAAALVRAMPEFAGRARLHVMLHEIWIDGSTSWRRKLVSAAQRRSVLTLCRHPRALIQTTNRTYQKVLCEHGVRATVLPLFGSIPIAETMVTDWLSPRLAAAGCDALSGRRDDWWLFTIFGTLHPIWPPLPLLHDLQTAAAAAGKRLALISVGHLGPGSALWQRMSAEYETLMPMIRLGEQPAERISALLQTADYGIATTPLPLIGKSATVAAMFDHGLPVVVNREDCQWPASTPADAREASLTIRLGANFAQRLREAKRIPPVWRLPEVASCWLDQLRGAAAAEA